VDSVLQDWIEVAEDHDRATQLGLGDQIQGTGQGHPLLQGLVRRSLNRRSVREGIAEGNPDFNDVAHLGGRPQRGGANPRTGVASREIGNERSPPRGSQRGEHRREPGLRQSSRQPSTRIEMD
jgi:hypothetical protein